MNSPKFWKVKFKKIQIIGIISILVILTGILIYEIYFDKPQYVVVRIKGSPGNWWWVTPRPPDWLANSIKIGDKEYNAMNRPTADVIGLNVYDAGGTTKDVYVTARIEAKFNKRTQKYTYKGEPVQIGGPISLNLNRTFFPGMVVEIYGDKNPKVPYVDKIIKIRYFGKWPWEYDAFKIGDKMTDGQGDVIAEIIDKESKPAEKETVTWSGQIMRTYSPIFQDFFVTLKVKALRKTDGLVFREEQYLKVGNQVWLMFPNYNFSAALIYEMD
jgi:hypothetical protein